MATTDPTEGSDMSIPALTRPELKSPMVVDLKATGFADTDAITVKIPPGKDAIIRLPRKKRVGHVQVIGGRTRVITGGYQTIGKKKDGSYPNAGPRNYGDSNILIKDGDAGATTWLEGLLVDASGGAQSDGFMLNCPNTNVDLYWCRVEGLLGALENGRHADCVQTAGGVKRLRIDHCTFRSHYNNLYLRRENSPLMPPVAQLQIRYSNCLGYKTNPATKGIPQQTIAGISIGTQPANDDCNQFNQCGPRNNLSKTNADLAGPVEFDHFYIDAASAGKSDALKFVHPDDGARTYEPIHPQLDRYGRIYWPLWRTQGLVKGAINVGSPPAGDYCPAAMVGLNYAKGIYVP